MSRTFISAALGLLCICVLPSPSRAGELPPGARVGLLPLQLPDGPRAFTERLSSQLSAQLKDGAAGYPRLASFELLPRGGCLPDEAACLGEEAKSNKLHAVVAGRVQQSDRGFGFELRLVGSDGREQAIQRGAVEGGPLDLASGLEHGLCELLGAAPCVGMLTISSDALSAEGASAAREAPIFIDNKPAGPLANASQLALPVGRHLIRAGKSERRVRVAYHRETKLLCSDAGGALALEVAPGEGELGQGESASSAPNGSGASSAPSAATATSAAARDRASANASGANRSGAAPAAAMPSALIAGSAPVDPPLAPRTTAGRLLLTAGGALLMASAGVELYARVQSSELDQKYQSGQLTPADASTYGKVHTAGVAALVVGAAGLGALAVGGVVLLLSPDGAAVKGSF